ncbi:MAG TPA: bifunctional folylpolyglutamate synthase/dihydrofolate synthase [Clostridiales bacterium]|mgnify:CR=1 FL=1|jgi:dihydrofolate synthase/folylpolyglutamate synthase|nr:bifunctional folylpolyglutamate synthase/dihydrofolate synthase [Clostridiales bacterium]HCS11743.1 bifunctional folylpolyglutamate synthase/dihydrofolate synthase [Clostridiales bacterium]
MNYEEAIEFIHSTYKFGSRLGMRNITKLMELLGNPQNCFKIIHVAGTNGKGSTCNLIHDVLMESGYKTGLFISPYLEEFTERIQINKQQIDKDSLARITELVKDKVNIMISEGYDHPTEFEVVTAIGFKYFQEKNIELLVLEVGLGGRFDATNVVKKPLVSVITSISYDHMEQLGDTLEKIAFEKAGIIKEDSSVVIYPQAHNITNVIKDAAKEKRAKVYEADKYNIEKTKADITGQRFKYLKRDVFELPELKINLLGEHQLLNALTALSALELIKKQGYNISSKSIVNGFSNCKFPGRFEILNRNPMIIIDGGHNIDGIRSFTNTFKEYLKDNATFFFGILKDKNPEEALQLLLPLAKEIYTLTPLSPRALKAAELAELIKKHSNIKVTPLENYEDIIPVIKNASKNEIIAFSGSLYMIGNVRTLLRNNGFANNIK